jgi:Leucine-rich repeat (LRR) protein
MRISISILTLTFILTLTQFFGGRTLADDVQETVKNITAMGGKCVLTPEKTIGSITFENSSALNEAAFELFAKQSDLEVLQVPSYRELNDAAVAKLAGLKKLKTLKLTNSGITDEAVKTIAGSFPNLVNLDLSSNTQLTDVSLKEISKLKNLESLAVLFCDFSEFGILNVASLPKLKTLDIRANMQIGNSGLGAIAGLPSLKSLKHRCPSVSDEGMEALAAAKGLENLEIQDFIITGQSGQYIKQLSKLTSLIIFRCENFDSSGLIELKGLKLNRLTLRGLPIDDTGLEVFQELPTLKRLYLSELPSVSDVGLLNLVHLKDLEVLEIWEVPITDKALETIVKLPNLKALSLRSTNISDAGLVELSSLPKLTALTLQGNANVTSAMIDKLQENKKLKIER